MGSLYADSSRQSLAEQLILNSLQIVHEGSHAHFGEGGAGADGPEGLAPGGHVLRAMGSDHVIPVDDSHDFEDGEFVIVSVTGDQCQVRRPGPIAVWWEGKNRDFRGESSSRWCCHPRYG